MVVLSVLYPATAAARFDVAYYRDVHLPMAREHLGGALLSIEAVEPTEPAGAAFRMITLLRFPSAAVAVEILNGTVMTALTADIPRFTDIAPVIQLNAALG